MANKMVSNGKNVQDFVVGGASSGLTRERSFVRAPQQIHQNKRRSLAFNHQSVNSMQHDIQQQQQQLRSKPAIEIYRPPSKLNCKILSCFEFVLICCVYCYYRYSLR